MEPAGQFRIREEEDGNDVAFKGTLGGAAADLCSSCRLYGFCFLSLLPNSGGEGSFQVNYKAGKFKFFLARWRILPPGAKGVADMHRPIHLSTRPLRSVLYLVGRHDLL